MKLSFKTDRLEGKAIKYIFESERVKKGQCSKGCPFANYAYWKDEWYCLLACKPTSLEVDPKDCPLEEEE